MAEHDHHDTTLLETLQSLIVAFVLAMTFRGFVTEGFVIPTGSMAPTLLGQHYLLNSDQTGQTFPVGHPDPTNRTRKSLDRVADPVLGPDFPGSGSRKQHRPLRMGDRILVLKSMYPFREPSRYDVVVFKNPTDPDGPSANYIKRLIGLPDEQVWLADGDVFAAPNTDDAEGADFVIQRKPEHVQRAVWQPVHDSAFVPSAPMSLPRRFPGPPWQGDGWDTSGRTYVCETTDPTTLQWDPHIRRLDDWTVYDSLNTPREPFTVTDLRVAAAIRADAPETLDTRLILETREHVLEMYVAAGHAGVRMRRQDDPDGWAGDAHPIDLPDPGRVLRVEFWHVDQELSVFIDGDRVARHPYAWSADERMRNAVGRTDWRFPQDVNAAQPSLRWRFAGSRIELDRVRTDRDLYYRPSTLGESANPAPPDAASRPRVASGTPGFGTHPTRLAVLGPDHYFMLGDNSQASLDWRLWGHPHPLVAEQVDDSPFVTHRKLIIGKAWVVYFPAPYPVTEEGLPFVPDFGRLRFIR
jgi:signal peptidase I